MQPIQPKTVDQGKYRFKIFARTGPSTDELVTWETGWTEDAAARASDEELVEGRFQAMLVAQREFPNQGGVVSISFVV